MAININHPENLIEGLSSITLKSNSGQTITFNSSSNTINVSSANINNVLDPINLQDAATKNYVDSNTNLSISADAGSGIINLATDTLTLNGTTYQVETSIVGNTITITLPTNMTVPGNLNVTTNLEVAGTVEVASLTEDRVVVVGSNGLLADSPDFTFTPFGTYLNSNLYVQGSNNIFASGGVNVTGEVTASNFTDTSLTDERIPFANLTGRLVDSPSLTFDVVNALLTVPNISSSNEISAGTIKDAALTQGRLVFSGAAGELTDSPDITYNSSTGSLVANKINVTNDATVSGTLTVSGTSTLASLSVSNLTSGRVTFAGTGGSLVDSNNLIWNGFGLNVNGNVGGRYFDAVNGVNLNYATTNALAYVNNSGALVSSNSLAWNGTTLALTGDQTISGTLSVNSDLTVTGITNVTQIIGSGLAMLDSISVLNDATVSGNASIVGNAVISGNLTVQGTTTSVNSTNTEIADNTITLNQGETGAGVSSLTSGIEIDRGSLDTASWKYSELTNSWEAREGTNLTAISSSQIDAGNVNITANTISTTDTNGDLNLQPNGSGQVLYNNKHVATHDDAIAYAIVFGG